MKKVYSPHFLLFVTAVTLVLIGFLQPDKTVDIHVHDTYFVIGYSHYYFGMGLLLLLLSVIVFLTKSTAWKHYFMWLHAVHCINFFVSGSRSNYFSSRCGR